MLGQKYTKSFGHFLSEVTFHCEHHNARFLVMGFPHRAQNLLCSGGRNRQAPSLPLDSVGGSGSTGTGEGGEVPTALRGENPKNIYGSINILW